MNGPGGPSLADLSKKLKNKFKHLLGFPANKVVVDTAKLDIDRADDAQNTQDLTNLLIEGWALVAEAVDHIDLVAGDHILAPVTCGLKREDIGRIYGKYPHALTSGFTLEADRLTLPSGYEGSIDLLVHTVGGAVIRETVVKLPSFAREAANQDRPVVAHVETAQLSDDGLLTVEGWVAALSDIESVDLYAAETELGAAEHGLNRPDVAFHFPAYANAARAGFRLVRHLTSDLTVCNIDIKVRSGGRVIHTMDATVQRNDAGPSEAREYIGFYSEFASVTPDGAVTLDGWAVAASGVAEIVITLDGMVLGRETPNKERHDVASQHVDIPSARLSGFTFQAGAGRRFEGDSTFTIQVTSCTGNNKAFDVKVPVREDLAEEPQPQGSMRLNVDSPRIVSGIVPEVIAERLVVNGWCIDESGVSKIEVFIDDAIVEKAYYGIRRTDVRDVFPEIEGSLLSGFAVSLPAAWLDDGEHNVELVGTANNGSQTRVAFKIVVERTDVETGPQVLRQKLPLREKETQLRILKRNNFAPKFQFLMPLADVATQKADVQRTIASLRRQAWERWQVTVALASGETDPDLDNWLAETGAAPFVKVVHAKRPLMTMLADFANDKAGTVLAGLLLPGDIVGIDSLLELAVDQSRRHEAAITYSDDRRYGHHAKAVRAFFKPDWSPDLLHSFNYIGRAFVANAALLKRITAEDRNINSPYGVVLGLTKRAQAVGHIRKILFELADETIDADEDKTSLARALAMENAVVEEGHAPGFYSIQRRIVEPGLVSIIIPSIAARGHVKSCIESIRTLSAYTSFEIILIDNIRGAALTLEQKRWKKWFTRSADKVIELDEPFNWSRFNNIGARAAKGEYLLFLNDDIEVVDKKWLGTLLANAQRPDVGIVGPQLLYPNGRVQHAGMFLTDNCIARHCFRFLAKDDGGYFGLALSQREVTAVTGACMMMRREVFDACGGFDEAHSVVNNDLDFCLRVRASGKSIIFTPYTELIHHELASRAKVSDTFNDEAFREAWSTTFALGDPFYSPHLSLQHDDFRYECEPLRDVISGYPIAVKDAIRNILIVKLDHIGDVTTAISAIVRTRERFPGARIHLLVGRSSVQLARMIPGVADVIEFQFFNPKSGLGMWRVTDEDYADLAARLAAYEFDLAIDMRKLADTRPVLRYTGATYLAGYDSASQFPWLDIPVAVERDETYGVKRRHISDDFVHMVEIVASAFDDNGVAPSALNESVSPKLSKPLADKFAELFSRPYVVVHPSAGNVLRQWPPKYFAMLIDLLVERENIAVAILGSPDEAEIVGKVLAALRSKERVYSLLGHTKLADVPTVIRNAVLFVGNNSGPSHIAGALDVPTVAVHSGVVTSEEWAPLGRDTVALRRDMSCSPCYLATPDACIHGVACLNRLPVGHVLDACRRMLRLNIVEPAPAPQEVALDVTQ